MKKSIYVLLAILLSACAATKPTPSATIKAMETATLETVSTPTGAVTITIQSAATSKLQALSTPTAAELLQEDLTQQAYDARATRIATEFGVVCYGQEQTEYASPSGKWVATFCGDKRDAILEITNGKDKRWVLQLTDYVDTAMASGGFRPEHWSNDEEYLYFTLLLGGSGGGTACFNGFGSNGLYRMKLNDGSVSNILPAGYDFSFSPTGRRLAYYGRGDTIIRDLQTGNEISIDTGDAIFGPVKWSPDGLELAYATCRDDNSFDSIKKSTVKIFSIQQGVSRTILEKENKQLTVVGWGANNMIEIYSAFNMEFEDLHFDLNSNQWLTPTPTP